MNTENIKNNDPAQLKQMIIFLKAELSKYAYKIEEYENSYHQSVIENLEQENAQLTIEKEELTKKLSEMQKVNYTTRFDPMQETKTEWLPVNKQLHEAVKKIKGTMNVEQGKSLKHEQPTYSDKKVFAEYKLTIEQFEKRLVELIKESSDQVHMQIESLRKMDEERLRFEEERHLLKKEVEEKNNEIERLYHDIEELKELNERNEVNLREAQSKNEDERAQELSQELERQIKKLLEKSLAFEETLDAKLALTHALEFKLEQISMEIEDLPVVDKAGESHD